MAVVGNQLLAPLAWLEHAVACACLSSDAKPIRRPIRRKENS